MSSTEIVGIETVFGKENHRKKIGKIYRDFKNYCNLSYIFFCAKMSQYSHYKHCLQEDLMPFGLEVSAQFGPKNHQYLKRFLELFQLFMNNFICWIVPKFSFYILVKLLTTWLNQFCVITHHNLFIPNIVYITHTNPILRLNLNYKNC